MSEACGKRGLDPFYKAHFTILEKQNNKSNKYWVECRYCPGSRLNHRDNRLLEHISEPDQCPGASNDVRMQALRMLNRKRQGGEEDAEVVEAGKKRKLKSAALESFLDRPIDKTVSDEYDRKMLRYD